jgi:hypothetical protein
MGLLPLIAALGLLPAGGHVSVTPSECRPLPARAPAGLPAPVDLVGRCGRIRVLPSGRVLRLPPARAARPPAAFFPENGTAVDSRGGHLVFLRAGKVVWRSRGRYRLYRTPHYLATAALGRDPVAFAFEQGPLYVARFGETEHVVSTNEFPLGWTRTGLLVTSRLGSGASRLLVRDGAGRLWGTIADRLWTFVFDRSSGTILYLGRDGVLRRSDGIHRQTLARGLSRWALVSPLAHGLIGIVQGKVTADHITILRADGSLFARAAFPGAAAGHLYVGGDSGLRPAPDGGAVAFTVRKGSGGRSSRGTDSVYVLRAGDTRPALLYRRRLEFAICERSVTLAWHGGWLLYAPSEGPVDAIDTSRRHRPVDLSALAARLAGNKTSDGGEAVTAAWAGRM